MTTVEYMRLLIKQYGSDIPQEEMDKAVNYESMLLDIAFNKGSMAAHDKIRKMLWKLLNYWTVAPGIRIPS